MSEMEIKRTPELIGAEIRTITQQARYMVLLYGIEIGRRLTEAKEMLEHGEWLPWLERETGFSPATASRYTRLYDEYGTDQSSLFGAETNFATLKNISVSNALRLLAVPAEEREEFAAENDVEHMSSRELDRLLKEKEEAEARAKKAESSGAKAAETAKAAERELESLQGKFAELEAENRELRDRPVEVAVQVDEEAVKDAAEKAREKADGEWTAKYEKLEKKLKAAEARAEKARAEADRQGEGAEKQRAEALAEAERARRELEELKKQMVFNNADTAVFKALFEQVQTDFNRLSGAWMKIKAADPATAGKLKAAVAALLDNMIKAFGM